MGVSDTPFCHIMRILLHCCHGEVMWPKSVAHGPWRSCAFERSAPCSVTYQLWWLQSTINLLAYKIWSLISFLLLLGMKQLSFRFITAVFRNKLMRSRGVATALHLIWCTAMAHTGYLQLRLSRVPLIHVQLYIYDMIHWTKTSHQKTGFALDRPNLMLADPISHSDYTK